MIKDMIKTGLFLFTITAIAGLLLAYSESLTGPIIQQNQLKAEEDAQRKVLPGKIYKDFSFKMEKEEFTYKVGYNESGNPVGVIFKVAPKGFANEINTMVGIDMQGHVVGYQILSLSETPGLGMKLKGDKFNADLKKLMSEKSEPIFKVKKDGGDVDAITAATISSRAFCLGLTEAQRKFMSIKSQIKELTESESTSNGGEK